MVELVTDKQVSATWPLEILESMPHGFCAGVVRAIEAIELEHEHRRKEDPEAITYCYHVIVHNNHVKAKLEAKGIRFVDDIDEVPDNEFVAISAHSASPRVFERARQKNLSVLDASCPLVDKVKREIRDFAKQELTILHIGHEGHDETVAELGQAPESIRLIQTLGDAESVKVPDPERVAMTMQTTFSLNDTEAIREILKKRFPNIIEPRKDDICFATQNRQNALKETINRGAKVVIVVGSVSSSNATRLTEVGEARGSRVYFVDDVSELGGREIEFLGFDSVGVTSGASTPEDKFQEVIKWFQEKGSTEISKVFIVDDNGRVIDESNMKFAPPKLINSFP